MWRLPIKFQERENVKSIFDQEVREKRNSIKGYKHRTSKSKKKVKVRFPSDKKNQIPGEVVVYSMNEPMIPYMKFIELPENERKMALKILLEKYNQKQIAKEWGVSISTVGNRVKEFGLSRRSVNKPTERMIGLGMDQKKGIKKLERKIEFACEGPSMSGSEILEFMNSVGGAIKENKKYDVEISIREVKENN